MLFLPFLDSGVIVASDVLTLPLDLEDIACAVPDLSCNETDVLKCIEQRQLQPEPMPVSASLDGEVNVSHCSVALSKAKIERRMIEPHIEVTKLDLDLIVT